MIPEMIPSTHLPSAKGAIVPGMQLIKKSRTAFPQPLTGCLLLPACLRTRRADGDVPPAQPPLRCWPSQQPGTSSHRCTRQRKAEPSSTFLACCKSSLPSLTFVFFLELGAQREANAGSGGALERQRAQRSGRLKAAHRSAGAVPARAGAQRDPRAHTRQKRS